MTPWTLLGVDFTSAPSRRKPITVAVGEVDSGQIAAPQIDPGQIAPGQVQTLRPLRVLALEHCPDWATFDLTAPCRAIRFVRHFARFVRHARSVSASHTGQPTDPPARVRR